MNRPPAALESLYQTLILDHYRRPRNQGEMEQPHARVHMHNPTCGDEIVLFLKMEGERISAIRFIGRGCSISQASASMMSELLRGKTLAGASEAAAQFKGLLRGEPLDGNGRSLGDLRALAGVARFPARVRCALLAWNAFEEAARITVDEP